MGFWCTVNSNFMFLAQKVTSPLPGWIKAAIVQESHLRYGALSRMKALQSSQPPRNPAVGLIPWLMPYHVAILESLVTCCFLHPHLLATMHEDKISATGIELVAVGLLTAAAPPSIWLGGLYGYEEHLCITQPQMLLQLKTLRPVVPFIEVCYVLKCLQSTSKERGWKMSLKFTSRYCFCLFNSFGLR